MALKSKLIPCLAATLLAATSHSDAITSINNPDLLPVSALIYDSPTPGTDSLYLRDSTYVMVADMQVVLQNSSDPGFQSQCDQIDRYWPNWNAQSDTDVASMLNGRGVAFYVSAPPVDATTPHSDIRVYKSPLSSPAASYTEVDTYVAPSGMGSDPQAIGWLTSYVRTWPNLATGSQRIGIFTYQTNTGQWQHQATFDATDKATTSRWATPYLPSSYPTGCGTGSFLYLPSSGYIKFGSSSWYEMDSVGSWPHDGMASFQFPAYYVESARQPVVPAVQIKGAQAVVENGKIVVTWGIDHLHSPQLAYTVKLMEGPTVDATFRALIPISEE